MARWLLWVGGALNVILAIFHVWLGFELHGSPGVPGEFRIVAEMLNVGASVGIAFLAVASLGFQREMLTTALGKLVSWLAIAIYASRAIEELWLCREPSAAITAVCGVVAAAYAGVLIAIRSPLVLRQAQDERTMRTGSR